MGIERVKIAYTIQVDTSIDLVRVWEVPRQEDLLCVDTIVSADRIEDPHVDIEVEEKRPLLCELVS
jgi:hypothetical protein